MLSSIDYLRTVARAEAHGSRGAWAEAQALWAQVVEANPVNGDHWERLAHACFRLGDHKGAIAAFTEAMRLGVSATREEVVAPGEMLYRIACCHARLGDAERALEALGQAVEQGYRTLDHMLVDDRLGSLHGDSRFAQLVGLDRGAGLSRDDGWRLDARLLAREIRRRAPAWPGSASGVSPVEVTELVEAIPRLSDAQIVVELTKMVALLDDGHGFVLAPEHSPELSRALPIQFYLFDEGLFVTASTPGQRRLLGARVEAVDGHDASRVLTALRPLVNHDNEYGVKEDIVQVLRRPPVLHAMGLADEPDAVTLSVQTIDQGAADVRVAAERGPWSRRNDVPAPPGWLSFPETLPRPLPLYLRNCGAWYWFEYLPGDRTVYFQFNNIRDDPKESIAGFTQRLFEFIGSHDVDRLVIDLRWNSGGDNMLVAPLIHGLIGCRPVNRPGGLFLIIGRRTFSAAQYTATAIEANTHAIFVGEPTGSRPNFVGETKPFRLPYSGIHANVSDLYWQNSWPTDHRRWIAPELYAPPTFAALRCNRDPAMEAIADVRGDMAV